MNITIRSGQIINGLLNGLGIKIHLRKAQVTEKGIIDKFEDYEVF